MFNKIYILYKILFVNNFHIYNLTLITFFDFTFFTSTIICHGSSLK